MYECPSSFAGNTGPALLTALENAQAPYKDFSFNVPRAIEEKIPVLTATATNAKKEFFAFLLGSSSEDASECTVTKILVVEFVRGKECQHLREK